MERRMYRRSYYRRTIWRRIKNQSNFIVQKKGAISSEKACSEHERKIVEYLKQEKEISNADAREITGLSAPGVRKVLKKMVEKGILYESGKNRRRRYFLK